MSTGPRERGTRRIRGCLGLLVCLGIALTGRAAGFLDAQRTYRETALEHLRAVGSFWAALYQLEAAVGGSWND